MRFLVFLPYNGTGLRPDFASVGLECLTGPDEPAPDNFDIDSFPPAGTAGRIYGWPNAEEMTGLPSYQPDNQTWIAAAPDPDRELLGKRYWIGIWNDEPPTEKDLARVRQVDGVMRIKASSGRWLVPSLLNLPYALKLDDVFGKFVRTPKPEFEQWRADCEWGSQLAIKLLRGEITNVPENAVDIAIRIIQLNYRIPRELVHRLGLLDDASIVEAVFVHARGLEEIQAAVADLDAKKNASQGIPESSDSASGSAG